MLFVRTEEEQTGFMCFEHFIVFLQKEGRKCCDTLYVQLYDSLSLYVGVKQSESERWWQSKGHVCVCQWPCVGVTETLDCETPLREKPGTCHGSEGVAWLQIVPGVYRSTSTAWGAASSSDGLILCFSVSAVVLGTIIGTRDTQTAVKERELTFTGGECTDTQ